MAKSIRSKFKRKMRAEKRVRYGAKEKAKLVAICEKAAKEESNLVEMKSASEVQEVAKSKHNHRTFKNEHGNYPKWMSRKRVDHIKKKKKSSKKKQKF